MFNSLVSEKVWTNFAFWIVLYFTSYVSDFFGGLDISDTMAPTVPKAKFAENEKLLCYHGPLLYEAKCVKIKKEGANFLYFVHYQGWNKNWDEWVNETRILKNNAENIEKKVSLFRNAISQVG